MRRALLALSLTAALSGCSSLSDLTTPELWDLGQEHLTAKRHAEAREVFDELVERDEADARALLMRAYTSPPKQALRDYERAIHGAPAVSLLYRTELLLDQHTYSRDATPRALTRLARLPLTPREALAHRALLGVCRLKTYRPILAIQHFEQVVQQAGDPKDPIARRLVRAARQNLVLACLATEYYEKAYGHLLALAGEEWPEVKKIEQGYVDPVLRRGGPNPERDMMLLKLGVVARLAKKPAAAELFLTCADPDAVVRIRARTKKPIKYLDPNMETLTLRCGTPLYFRMRWPLAGTSPLDWVGRPPRETEAEELSWHPPVRSPLRALGALRLVTRF